MVGLRPLPLKDPKDLVVLAGRTARGEIREGFSYTEYLAGVDDGTYENIPAPKIAVDYWKLSPESRLRDVILVVRADEAGHRDVNHGFADDLAASAA